MHADEKLITPYFSSSLWNRNPVSTTCSINQGQYRNFESILCFTYYVGWSIPRFEHFSPYASHTSRHSLEQTLVPVRMNRSSSGLGVRSLAWRMCSVAAGEKPSSSLTQPNRVKVSLTFKPLTHPLFRICLNYCMIMLDYPKICLQNVKKKKKST